MAIVRHAEQLHARLVTLVERLRAPDGLPDRWTLEEYEVEQGVSFVLRRDARRLVVELDALDETRGCFTRTERFNVYYASPDRPGTTLAPDEARALERVIEIVRALEASLPSSARTDADPARTLIREIEVARVLVRDGDRGYYINPYVGCMIACPYCYAIHRADFSRVLEGAPHASWGKWLDVKVNAPEVLAREVASLSPGPVRLSPIVTDPYQPVEKTYRITSRCLAILAAAGFAPIVLTRSAQVVRDLAVLASVPGSAVGMSIPTDDDAIREAFEPNADAIDLRIETLIRAHEMGIRTFAVIQPILPMDPIRLVEKIAPYVAAVRLGPMYERQRTLPIYEALGRPEAIEEPWAREMAAQLTEGFRARGVLVDPKGPEWRFLA